MDPSPHTWLQEHFPYHCDPDEGCECRFSWEKTACSLEVSPYTNREMLYGRGLLREDHVLS
jgi:hypothetical protein